MPPGADMPMALVSAAAAERAGLHPYRAPTGVNSVAYDGRPACVDCGFCAGYGCPVHAKGDPIASLQRALRTGRGELRSDAYVTEIVRDGSGRRATGVRYLDLAVHPDPPVREVRAARAVVLAAGAFETPRLLLRTGLGGDLVGRYLTYHFQTFTVGIFPEATGGERGRSVTHLHDDLVVDTPALRGRGSGGRVALGARRHRRARGRRQPRRGGDHLPDRLRATPRPWPTAPCGDGCGCFTMQGEDLPQAGQPGRPRPVGARRVGPARRAG